MQSTTTFDIIFRKKIPYWSSILFAITLFLFVMLFLFYLVMLPSDSAPTEMRVAYYILVVPQWLKDASAYSFIGLLFLIPLYNVSKTYKGATLSMDINEFSITGAAMDRVITVPSIRKIFVNDIKVGFTRKEAIEIVIKQNNNQTTSFLLMHYLQGEELMDALSKYEHIEFAFYTDYSIMDHDDDEMSLH